MISDTHPDQIKQSNIPCPIKRMKFVRKNDFITKLFVYILTSKHTAKYRVDAY